MVTWRGGPARGLQPERVHRQNGNGYNARHAEAAGLRYVCDTADGIRRVRHGSGFRYVHPAGGTVRDSVTLTRIRALAIPPAWSAVWIAARADAHLQATGRDARGRKQYRYHPRWREIRDETKFGRMADFARALPAIRRRVRRDLARPGLPREKALAAVVRLLETTLMRVGNLEYARQNDSFGLTTLRSHQVRVRGPRMKFRFRGKSGVYHDIELADPRLARIVRRMQDLPGEELVQYRDESGGTHRIDSADVNAYLKDITGRDFTSKDFRTWNGTVLAARALRRLPACTSLGEGRRNVAQAIAAVAKQLGNTQAVCRKCYVHPAVIDGYLDGSLAPRLARAREEKAVASLLRAWSRRSRANGGSLIPALARSLAAVEARRLRAQPEHRVNHG